jgi:class 3 adenylate cyclase/tetratricopeptide (TPR) repeat protein
MDGNRGGSEGFRKQVTAVFADVVGSTALAERFDPETFRELMLAFLERMASVVEAHGGVIEHLAGDGVMGVFGTEVAQADDALRAVRAASAMFDALEELNAEIEPRLDARLEMRVGVNTGTVVVGREVAGRKVSLGDTMNVAARLQSWAPAGGLVIGEETYALVRRDVNAEPAGELELRGRREPITAYRILGAGIADTGALPEQPLVGRNRELSLLTVAFERSVARGSPEFVTLLGDAGAGKTRLLSELVERYGGRAAVLIGRCLSYGEGITWWPVAEIVRQAAGITESDDAGSARAKIAAAMNGADAAGAATSELAQLIGVEQASGSGDQILWALRLLLRSQAARRPLVVLLEDLQWAEEPLLDLVQQLVERLDAPVLLACTGRFELLARRPSWSEACPTTIAVGPLSDEDIDALVSELVGDALPRSTRGRLVELAAGNPLFVEQVLHMLIDDGRLRHTEEGWVAAGDLESLEVPPSIEATLASRVDHLDQAERECAERAAVVGMEFFRSAVEQMAGSDASEALAGLARKLVIEPVRRRGAAGDMMRFRHILLRDAVYGAIPKARRAVLHERAGDWMLSFTQERRGEAEEIVGYHFEAAARYHGELFGRAGDAERVAAKASEHLMEAGRRAAARQEDMTAAQFYARVVALLGEEDSSRLEPLLALGTSLVRGGETTRAAEALAELRRRAARGQDPRTDAEVRILELSLRRLTDPGWWAEHGRSGASELTGVFQKLGDDLGAAKAWHLLGKAHSDRGEQAAAQEAFEHALEFARSAGDEGVEAWIRYWLLQVAVFGPAPCDRVVARAREDLDWARARGNRSLEGSTLARMGEMLSRSGHADEAASAFESAQLIFEELGHEAHLAYLPISTTAVEPLLSDPAACERELRSALAYFDSIGAKHISATVAPMLAGAIVRQGDRAEEALALTQRAEEIAAPDDLDAQVKWRLARVEALLDLDDLAEAERLAREAIAQAEPTDTTVLLADSLAALGSVMRAAASPEEARPPLQRALGLYEAKGDVVSAGRQRAALRVVESAQRRL